MSNIIDSIRLSGVTYGIKGSGGTETIELTQAQYDALVDKDPNTFYVITDAQAGDLTNYYTKSETNTLLGGKADTATTYTKTEVDNAITAATSTKQDTLVSGTNIKTINNESILGSGNIDIQGGSTYTAGRGISIANDTISFNLPISAGTVTNSIIIGDSTNISNSSRAIATGYKTKAQQNCAFAQGYKTDAGQENSHAEGYETKAYGINSHSEGRGTSAMTLGSHAEGLNTITSNSYEHTQGQYNVSNKANTTFGDSGNTLFSVGNGTSNNARHNAFEIRQNGDIYLTLDGQDVKLQDQLGGGGGGGTVESAITSGSTNAVESKALWSATTYNKEVTLEFDNSSRHYSTNFPSGCTTVKVTVPNGTGYIHVYFYSGSTNYQVGIVNIQKYGSTPNVGMNFTDASYTIENNDVIITYPASKSVNKVGADNYLEGAIVKAVVEGAWVNENTYMSAEVDGKIKALDDKKLDATAYTPTVVDSQLNAASTNPVQNQALYSELRFANGESETTLTFEYGNSTNYPNGCTKLNVEVVGSNNASTIYFYNDNQNLGKIDIANFGSIVVANQFNGASYEISGTTVIITYPTVIVTKINVGSTGNYVYKAIAVSATPLKDQVVAIQDSLSGYVTTDTDQVVTSRKTFTNSDKAIEFKQVDDNSKVGFKVKNSASTANELAAFELRPNTFTVDGVRHPLLYFGHYRSTNIANAGVPQTYIGFRQYDQLNAAAYHYLMPLPEKAKTPFSLTTTFKDYYAPMGFKNGSTMITADDTGVVDLSSELGGLKLVKLSQSEYDSLLTYDSNTLYVIVN